MIRSFSSPKIAGLPEKGSPQAASPALKARLPLPFWLSATKETKTTKVADSLPLFSWRGFRGERMKPPHSSGISSPPLLWQPLHPKNTKKGNYKVDISVYLVVFFPFYFDVLWATPCTFKLESIYVPSDAIMAESLINQCLFPILIFNDLWSCNFFTSAISAFKPYPSSFHMASPKK